MKSCAVPIWKGCFDVVVASSVLLVTSPLLFLIAISVRAVLGRPVLFRQQRPGLNGRPFIIYKFRTMRGSPDSSLESDAQRMSPFGAFLRHTSLDELPELWNVLRGEMSMVGPRPLLMQYLDRYSPEQRRRHEVLPGLTGWAQINGRNAVTWADRFALDLWYVDHQSFWLDLRILGLTIVKVLKRENIAYPEHVTMPEFVGTSRNDQIRR